MDLAKVIKGYFIFLMCIVTFAALSYNSTVKHYMLAASTFAHIDIIGQGRNTDESLYASVYGLQDIKAKIFNNENLYENKSPNLFGFSISNDPEKSLMEPGTKNVLIMNLNLTAYENSATLKSLKLKVHGIDEYDVENVAIEVDGEVLAFGKRDEQYFNFGNLDYEIAPNSKERFEVKVDLSENLTTGERLRLDIEKPEDIVVKVNGKKLNVNDYYPIKGKYLSIAKPRPWSFSEDE